MNVADSLTYTVTPGPEVLAKMGQSWTLFASTGVALAHFSKGPEGEPPAPASVSMPESEAVEVVAAGYQIESAAKPPSPAQDGELLAMTAPSRPYSELAADPAEPGSDKTETRVIEPIPAERGGEPGEGAPVDPGEPRTRRKL